MTTPSTHNPHQSSDFLAKLDDNHFYYSLPQLETKGLGPISRLPISIRIILESALRNWDETLITHQDIYNLANWNPKLSTPPPEVPFIVSRIILQDFTGVPLLVDLAAMRDAMASLGKNPSTIEPLVPVDLVVDHSIQVDKSGSPHAFLYNLQKEFQRNQQRYSFLKWGQDAFKTFNVIPPSIGIVHQVNLEYLATLVFKKRINNGYLLYPDTLVGTDSHTTMINGLGIVGWGVGGIEAEAGMLGQPLYIQSPEVIGFYLTGTLPEGVTATDLTLKITQLLRKEGVVEKFIEFFGPGTSQLSVADRSTIANMAPEYGATMGFFPIDEQSLSYLKQTGRPPELIELVKQYYTAQGLFGTPQKGQIDYTKIIELDLNSIQPSVAGPKRPQDCIDLPLLPSTFASLFEKPVAQGGFGKKLADLNQKPPFLSKNNTAAPTSSNELSHGSVVIAAITSCTNTSNPSVMIAAGLLAKAAYEKGLRPPSFVKTSLAPGSRVVTEYLQTAGLQDYLDALGFHLVGYGCTTCIGNSGPLDPILEKTIKDQDLVVASVLSGNRNFEARIHPSIKANFLMSPPLVVAFALAGTIYIDLQKDPLGIDAQGHPIYLKDIWPSSDQIQTYMANCLTPDIFIQKYKNIHTNNSEWNAITPPLGIQYQWDLSSTYIQAPPFFKNFSLNLPELPNFKDMRPLLILGDSVTTDHISPAGSIQKDGPAGLYLQSKQVPFEEFNSFGSRRGNDQIMTRGTFANPRIKNKMIEPLEGGFTYIMPEGELQSIYQASQIYQQRETPLIIFAGQDYGMGSSRDWAAKGTALLGVKAVVASSFERIHRNNLIGMGVLPLEFQLGENPDILKLDKTQTFTLEGLSYPLTPKQKITLVIHHPNGTIRKTVLTLRLDSPIEIEYYRHGGILPYVLRQQA